MCSFEKITPLPSLFMVPVGPYTKKIFSKLHNVRPLHPNFFCCLRAPLMESVEKCRGGGNVGGVAFSLKQDYMVVPRKSAVHQYMTLCLHLSVVMIPFGELNAY